MSKPIFPFLRPLAICLSLLLALELPAAALQGVYGVNYYPRQTPWSLFWTAFSAPVIAADFDRIQRLGFNTVRVFVPYDIFGGAAVEPTMKARLHQLLQLAARRQLRVIVTLFDFYGDYANPGPALRHARQLVAGLETQPTILAWDLKNESDSDYARAGKATVLAWIHQLAAGLRAAGVRQPLTASTSRPEAAADAQADLDYLTFHYYGPIAGFEPRLAALRQHSTKPVLLGEYGFHTWTAGPDPHDPNQQFNYFMALQASVRKQRLAGSLAWTLYDFPPQLREAWVLQAESVQAHLGLIDSQGKPQPGLAALQQGIFLRDASSHEAVNAATRRIELVVDSARSQTLKLQRRQGDRLLTTRSWLAGSGVQSFSWDVDAIEIAELLSLRQRYRLLGEVRDAGGRPLPRENLLELRRN